MVITLPLLFLVLGCVVLHDFDLERAYKLILKNATVPGKGGRRYLDEYMERGWIAEKDTVNVPTWDEYKGL